MAFPKTCFNPTCNCKELKIVREVTLRCSNCHCGVKVEEVKIENLRGTRLPHISQALSKDSGAQDLLFTVVKDRKN